MTQITRITAFLLTSFLLGSSLIAAKRPANQERDKESDSCEAYLKSKAPKHRIARQIHTHTNHASALTMHVSIDQKDVTRDKLIALSCQLGVDHASEEHFFLFILDTFRAAKRFNPLGAGTSGQTNLSYRGLYGFSREPGSAYGQSLAWKPDRNDPNHWVEINLGPPPKPPGH